MNVIPYIMYFSAENISDQKLVIEYFSIVVLLPFALMWSHVGYSATAAFEIHATDDHLNLMMTMVARIAGRVPRPDLFGPIHCQEF